MIVLFLLAVSWMLLRIERKGLGALGFNQPANRAREFMLGALIMGSAAALQQIGFGLASGVSWQVNPTATAASLGRNLLWNVNSALMEELLFRGYLLYVAIRIFGEKRAVFLAAAAFGIYHWFSYGVMGNLVAMAYVFVLTASFGGMGAFAFAATRSMAAPIGLHLGWNLVSYVIFSAGPLGPALLIPANGAAHLKPPGISGLLLSFFLPLAAVALVIVYLVLNEKPERKTQPVSV